MTDPNAPRGLKRVWVGVLVVVIILLTLYVINRVTSPPLGVSTDSVPGATPPE